MIRLAVADWDETITRSDTIKYLAEAAYIKKRNFQPPFQHFTNVYLSEYKKYNDSVVTPARSIPEEIKYQQNLKQVELASIKEIERLQLFQGLSRDDFRVPAGSIEIHSEFKTFVQLCKRYGIPVYILSVNWSKVLIQEVLRLHGISPEEVKIIANEFTFDAHTGLCTGYFDPSISIRTGYDKLQIMKGLNAEEAMYVGDSRTDLLAMLASRVGVVFNKKSTEEKAEALGVQVKDLHTSTLTGATPEAKNTVYSTSSWQDINRFIERTYMEKG